MRRFSSVEEIEAAQGEPLGVSDWMVVTQAVVDQFAESTGDDQWLHVDVERATRGPFGAPIAHGLLTLALGAHLGREVFSIDIEGPRLNYGVNRVRFPTPVRVGERIRAQVMIAGVHVTPSGTQLEVQYTTEVEGRDKPGCVATFLILMPELPSTDDQQ